MKRESFILKAAIETEKHVDEMHTQMDTMQQHIEEITKNQNVVFENMLPIIWRHVRDDIVYFEAWELLELEEQAAAGNPIYSLHNGEIGILLEFKDGTTRLLNHTRHITAGF